MAIVLQLLVNSYFNKKFKRKMEEYKLNKLFIKGKYFFKAH